MLRVDTNRSNPVSLVMNVPSDKMGRKDVLKIEDLELSQEELDRLALISPQASGAIIMYYGVAEKSVVELNEELLNVARCTFWNCITLNKMEPLPQKLRVVSRDPIEVRCYYCGRGQNMEEIIENIL